ncbi:hypothetical protein B0H19DRAFT_1273342 [Mycena capillaripes]|nr:hypothetical protein B0H19DRAFT_1273342 [Mycena capillaripes]
MFFSFFHCRFAFACVLFIAGSVAALPTILNSEAGPHRLGDGAQLFGQAHRVRAVEEAVDNFMRVAGPVAGGTFVAICLIIFVCCFRRVLTTPEMVHDPSRKHGARAVEKALDIFAKVAGPIAGGVFVSICLLILVFCFRTRKGPKEEDMTPLPVAERPPWAA